LNMRKPDSKIRKSKNKAKQCLRKISALLFSISFCKISCKEQGDMDIQIIIAKNITSQKRK